MGKHWRHRIDSDAKKESHLVVMTMMSTICSHTMRQKSPNVLGKGPGGHERVGFEQKEGLLHGGLRGDDDGQWD